MTARFTMGAVARLLRLPEAVLRDAAERGAVPTMEGGESVYTFAQVSLLRAGRARLREEGADVSWAVLAALRPSTAPADVVEIGGAVRERNRASALCAQGQVLLTMGDEVSLAGAAAIYQAAVDTYPRCAPAFIGLGQTMVAMGMAGQARAVFAAACRVFPLDPVPHRLLGDVYLSQGDTWRAFGQYRAALRLDPHHPATVWTMALAVDILGDHPSAVKHAALYLSLDPKGAWAEAAQHMLDAEAQGVV